MFSRKLIISLIASVTLLMGASLSTAEVPQRVLFTGNSFSYFNNGIQNHYGNFIRAAGDWQPGTTYTRLKTISGGRIFEHEDGLAQLLDQASKPYNAVVLQGYSAAATDESRREVFLSALSRLSQQLVARDIQPIYFATWAYKDAPEMTEAIHLAYQQVANEEGAIVVPVGRAFAEATRRHPEIELYSPDVLSFDESGQVIYKPIWKHPSLEGTYLAAATFYALLRGESPVGSVYTAGLDADVAAKLQQVAWDVAEAHR